MNQPAYPTRPPTGLSERGLEIVAGGEVLPLVCRWPDGITPRGFIIFCHGLGASGSDYAELSRYWAQHGYLAIHPTFPDSIRAVARAEPQLGVDPESDLTGWANHPRARPRLYEMLHTPFYWLERIRIVRQTMGALDTVFAATCGRYQASIRGAITGHSFGAYTAQLFAGAEIDLPDGPRSFKDDRFAAAILLSAQGRDQQGLREGSWDGIDGPTLNVTGTRDGGARGQDWHWKVEPYDLAPAGDKYLAVLTDADHFLGGIARPKQSPMPEQRSAVKQITLAFLDAYLVRDAAANEWLGQIVNQVDDCPLLFGRK